MPCRTGTFAYINAPATEFREKSRLTAAAEQIDAEALADESVS